jgi:hypothetical protein
MIDKHFSLSLVLDSFLLRCDGGVKQKQKQQQSQERIVIRDAEAKCHCDRLLKNETGDPVLRLSEV